MRKLIVSMNVTLDGFMAGPCGELDWHFENWTTEMAETLYEELSCVDTILLGRVTYEAMASYWPSKSASSTALSTMTSYADLMNSCRKIVFSSSLRRCKWINSTVVNNNFDFVVQQLKNSPGKNMIIYGSGTLADHLVTVGVVDEYQLWVHPVLLGKGKPLFFSPHQVQRLKFAGCKRFSSGVVILRYIAQR